MRRAFAARAVAPEVEREAIPLTVVYPTENQPHPTRFNVDH